MQIPQRSRAATEGHLMTAVNEFERWGSTGKGLLCESLCLRGDKGVWFTTEPLCLSDKQITR
jgi:hypothetical protein